jgi:hypothetical protein
MRTTIFRMCNCLVSPRNRCTESAPPGHWTSSIQTYTVLHILGATESNTQRTQTCLRKRRRRQAHRGQCQRTTCSCTQHKTVLTLAMIPPSSTRKTIAHAGRNPLSCTKVAAEVCTSVAVASSESQSDEWESHNHQTFASVLCKQRYSQPSRMAPTYTSLGEVTGTTQKTP